LVKKGRRESPGGKIKLVSRRKGYQEISGVLATAKPSDQRKQGSHQTKKEKKTKGGLSRRGLCLSGLRTRQIDQSTEMSKSPGEGDKKKRGVVPEGKAARIQIE